MKDKLTILLLASESMDLFYIPTGKEQRTIEDRIRTGSHGDRFEVISRPSLILSEFSRELMEYDPQVVHLSAEGRAGEGILFEDEAREARAVGTREMAGLIRELKGSLRLMFLNACHTQEHADAISKEVDYVVGMNGQVESETVLAFARCFYQALGYGRTVERSFKIATEELKAGGYPTADAPVLRIKAGVDTSQPLFGERAIQWPEISGSQPELTIFQNGVARTVLLRDLGTQFITQLSIAGHFQDASHSPHAIYLDSDLYVHRESAETSLLQYAEKFAASNAARGNWVCVIGDAGHGKSSLLWYVYKTLTGHSELTVLPFLAQLEGHWGGIETAALRLRSEICDSSKLVVVIDTLDILVGIADPSLAAMLNSLRSAGCLVITTSRRQEAERLFRITPSDYQVELKRFNDREAKQAIRNYVTLAYRHWSGADRERQFDKIWGILEQQRTVQELDLEPLILRMLFEAYVPNDIPRDINTQQVYKKFWNERVLFDRMAKDADDRFAREQLCRIIAREIGFDGGHSDKLAVDKLKRSWTADQTVSFPHAILEGLVSSGVVQWAEGVSTIRFFHQTFLEYAAAYDLLSSNESVIEKRIESLLGEVARFRLFRAPILKQFAIQAFENGNHKWKDILQGLREIDNELAARMALEIVGKLPNDAFAAEICGEWVRTSGSKLQNVICETVRHYP